MFKLIKWLFSTFIIEIRFFFGKTLRNLSLISIRRFHLCGQRLTLYETTLAYGKIKLGPIASVGHTSVYLIVLVVVLVLVLEK
jgi:hypothetical protein